MKKNEIIVSVKGYPGAGKSTVSQLIVEALNNAGIEAIISDSSGLVDKDEIASPELHAIRVASIAKTLKVKVKQSNINRVSLLKNS